MLHHVGAGQHLVHAPAVGGAHVHVLDEAQHDAGAAEMPRHAQDLMLVGAALDHHVDLQAVAGLTRTQPCCARGLDAFQHVGHGKVHVVHRAEHRVVQPVQAHGHPLQARRLERLRLARQQRAVGGECQVQRLAVRRAQRGQLLDQHLDVLAQQRLAAGQTDLAHTVGDEQFRRAGDFLEAQQRAVWQVT
jgi:hypothetical protein